MIPCNSFLARVLHQGFEAGLFLQGLLGVAQISAALGLYFTPGSAILGFAEWMTRNELLQDPADPFALWLLAQAQHLAIQAATFVTLYFIIHGVLNLGMALALARRIHAAYPVAIAVLFGFIAYQLYRFAHTHAPMLVLLSVFDLAIIVLAWREYRLMSAQNHA